MKKPFIRVGYLGIILLLSITESFSRTNAPIETSKFRVETKFGNYDYELHLPLKDVRYTNRVIEILKENTKYLANYFEYAPREVIHFNIDEYDHEANGSATVFPRDQISLRKFPPIGAEHLTVGDDYLKGLVLHELIHIIHMDQNEGVPRFVETIFGAIGKFGGVAPRWFIEGVATWGESKFTNGGRLRNKLMRVQFEQAISRDGFCETIDCIDSPGVYPFRQFPYWAGAYFLESLENKKEGSIKCLVTANNNNIPFFLNSAFKECFDKTGTELYEEFRKEIIQRVTSREQEGEEFSPIKEVLGPKDYSNGFIYQEKTLLSSEGDYKVRKIIAQEVGGEKKEEVEIPGRLSAINKLSESSSSISYFTDRRDKTPRSTKEFKEGALTKVEGDADYNFRFKDQIISFKYFDGRWHINGGEFSFDHEVEISQLKYSQSGIFFKLYDPRAVGIQLAFYSFAAKKVVTIHQFKSGFNILESCSDEVLINKDGKAYFVSSKDLIELNDDVMKRIVMISAQNKDSVVVMEGSKNGLYHWTKGCSDFKKMKSKYKKIGPKEYEKSENEIVVTDIETKEYPAWNHFLPKYWFFDYTAQTDSLSAWGVRTTLTDPDERHTLNLRAVLYSEISQVAPDISYTYQFPDYHYLSLSHVKTYSNSTFRKGNDSKELTLMSYAKLFQLPGVDFITTLYGGFQKVDDFISKRDEKEYGVLLKAYKLRAQFDDFWQEVAFKGRFFKKDVENYEGYNGIQSTLRLDISPLENFFFFGHGSYSSLDKESYFSGVLYGGGNYTDFHQFYGLPYSDIFGNEIKSARAGGRLILFDIYRGIGLVPIFLEQIHLKGGTDFMAADRILVGEQVLRNKSVQSIWGGVRLDLTLGYALPLSLEIIQSKVDNPSGEDVTSTSTVISGGLTF